MRIKVRRRRPVLLVSTAPAPGCPIAGCPVVGITDDELDAHLRAVHAMGLARA